MNVRPGCLTFTFYQNVFYDKMDLKLYFDVANWTDQLLLFLLPKVNILKPT